MVQAVRTPLLPVTENPDHDKGGDQGQLVEGVEEEEVRRGEGPEGSPADKEEGEIVELCTALDGRFERATQTAATRTRALRRTRTRLIPSSPKARLSFGKPGISRTVRELGYWRAPPPSSEVWKLIAQ